MLKTSNVRFRLATHSSCIVQYGQACTIYFRSTRDSQLWSEFGNPIVCREVGMPAVVSVILPTRLLDSFTSHSESHRPCSSIRSATFGNLNLMSGALPADKIRWQRDNAAIGAPGDNPIVLIGSSSIYNAMFAGVGAARHPLLSRFPWSSHVSSRGRYTSSSSGCR